MSETTIPASQPLYPVTTPQAVYGALRALPPGADIVLEYDEGYVTATVSEALSEWDRAYTPADLFTIPSRSALCEPGGGVGSLVPSYTHLLTTFPQLNFIV